MAAAGSLPASIVLIPLLVLWNTADGQVTAFPFQESFDTLTPPALAPAWSSSRNRSPGVNDFTSTSGTPLSSPNALLSTNATISQELVSPGLLFLDILPDSLFFYTRRSSSHQAPVIIEIASGSDPFVPLLPGDTLRNPGSTDYIRHSYQLPDALSNREATIRWRVVAGTSGSTGTFRIDNVLVTARHRTDLAVIRTITMPSPLLPDDIIETGTTIRNTGFEAAVGFEVSQFIDRNMDSVAQVSELVAQTMALPVLSPGDSVVVSLTIGQLESGAHRIITTLFHPSDTNRSNDTLMTPLFVGYPRQSVIVNEIMYDPLAGESEYVELYNAGAEILDLAGWRLLIGATDEFDLPEWALSPGGFLVLAADSAVVFQFPELAGAGPVLIIAGESIGLNNDGDPILVIDPAGNRIDTLTYSDAWHHPAVVDPKGRSLEKISPLLPGADSRNWSTCVLPEGGTPGRRNSILTGAPRAGSNLTFTPNPFSPDGDGHDDFTIVRFELPVSLSAVTIRIYDIAGRLIRRLASNEPAGSTGEIIWDGLDDDGRRGRIGVYVVALEARTSDGALVGGGKGAVVLAGSL